MAKSIRIGTATLHYSDYDGMTGYGAMHNGDMISVAQIKGTTQWHALHWPGHQNGKPMPKDYRKHVHSSFDKAVADLKKRAKL